VTTGDPRVVLRGPQLQRRPRRRLAAALQQRRRLRVGLVQLIYVAGALALGLVVPRISFGSTVPTSRATEMLVSVGAGFVPFLGIVYSMLFLVVQFGSSTYTPRLNLFRDARIVWHGFAFFTAVIVFAFTAAFEIGSQEHTTLLVPITLGVAILIAITLMRALQTTALKSIQLSTVLDQLDGRGHGVIDGVHPEPLQTSQAPPEVPAAPRRSEACHELRWSGRASVLQRLDVPQLLQIAEEADAWIDICVAPGQTIFDGQLVAEIVAEQSPPDAQLLETFGVGPERTFEQDPALALRLLADIALRALSPAVNDPTTAVQSLDIIADLLRTLIRRDLGAVLVNGAGDSPRIVVRLLAWDDYLSVALDEIISAGSRSPHVQRRLVRLLQDLAEIAPDLHREAVKLRLAEVMDVQSQLN
jgi:uncharacterized membrane protein